jgi:hypothetical protein
VRKRRDLDVDDDVPADAKARLGDTQYTSSTKRKSVDQDAESPGDGGRDSFRKGDSGKLRERRCARLPKIGWVAIHVLLGCVVWYWLVVVLRTSNVSSMTGYR